MDPPPPPQPIPASVPDRMTTASNRVRTLPRKISPLFLSAESGHHKSHTSPNAAVETERLLKRDADGEPPVVTRTVKFAVPPLLRLRESGFGAQVAFTGTCVQVNVTTPLEPEAETIESE